MTGGSPCPAAWWGPDMPPVTWACRGQNKLRACPHQSTGHTHDVVHVTRLWTPCIHPETPDQHFLSTQKTGYLCELADGGEAMGQRLVGGEAVPLHGVGGLWGAVARLQVRRGGSWQTSRVEHGLRLRTTLTGLRDRTGRFRTSHGNLVSSSCI